MIHAQHRVQAAEGKLTHSQTQYHVTFMYVCMCVCVCMPHLQYKISDAKSPARAHMLVVVQLCSHTALRSTEKIPHNTLLRPIMDRRSRTFLIFRASTPQILSKQIPQKPLQQKHSEAPNANLPTQGIPNKNVGRQSQFYATSRW